MQSSVIHTLASEQFSTIESFKHRRDKVKYVFTKLFPGVTQSQSGRGVSED